MAVIAKAVNPTTARAATSRADVRATQEDVGPPYTTFRTVSGHAALGDAGTVPTEYRTRMRERATPALPSFGTKTSRRQDTRLHFLSAVT
jgi:hypothetical protein